MKKKLLIILGAGSSSALGLPSVECVDRLIEGWGTEWARQRGTTDHFQELWKFARTYYERGLTQSRPALNFENVLGDMIAMAHWMEPPPWGNTLRQAACGARLPDLQFRYHREQENETAEAPLATGLLSDESDIAGGEWASIGDPSVAVDPLPEAELAVGNGKYGERGKYGAYIELMDEYSFLLERLAQHMRVESQRPNSANEPEEDTYRELLGGLRENFDIGVYNLNYDTAALDALPGAYIGFDESGTFESRVVHERKDWEFVYRLHGSVHHSLNRRYTGDQIVWRPNLDGEFFDGPEGQWSETRSNGIKIPRTTLVAGGFKLDQLLFEPFQSYHASLVRHVHAADAILIGGYGFGDAHMNFALRNRLSLTQNGLRMQASGSSLANYRLAEVFMMQHNYQSAANSFRDALRGDGEPKWTEVWCHINLGKIFDITGQRERAVNEYRLAVQTNDNTQGAVNEARSLMQHPFKRDEEASGN
jgi:tetratricopeptide (TPR) repeat protein